MSGKQTVFYTLDGRTLWYADPCAGKIKSVEAGDRSMDTVVRELEEQYPHVEYLDSAKWDKYMTAWHQDRARLNSWVNGGHA